MVKHARTTLTAALTVAAGTITGISAASAQQTLTLSECRQLLQMDPSFVRANVRSACMNALNGGNESVSRAEPTPSGPPVSQPPVSNPGGGGGGLGISLNANAGPVYLDAATCASLTGSTGNRCRLVEGTLAAGVTPQLLDGNGVQIGAGVGVGGSGQGLLDVDADVDLGGTNIADVGVSVGGGGGGGGTGTGGGGIEADVDLGGNDVADVSIGGGGGLNVSLGGQSIIGGGGLLN